MAATVEANAALPVNNPQPRLPPEICERIIDHLFPYHLKRNDDRLTLLNCALVCRGWYAESRVVFFEQPFLLTRKQAIVFVKSLTKIPLLGARVRRLQIGFSVPDVTGPELASMLVMLAGKLPKLASLGFYSVSFENCSMRNLAFWSLHEFSHITFLWLSRVTLPSAIPFFQVICSFPRLQHLECHNLHWSKPRSMAPLPEHHRMPLTTVTSLGYDLSCFEDIGPILLGLLGQAILSQLTLSVPLDSPAALVFTQDMLNLAGRGLEMAAITFRKPQGDAGGNLQSLLLHPISLEANVHLQKLDLKIDILEIHGVTLVVQSVLLRLLKTLSSKDLQDIWFYIEGDGKWETDALLNAFDPEVCIQIDDFLAEGQFPKLRDVFMCISLPHPELDDSQCVGLCTEICARFPKLYDKNMLTIHCGKHRFPSDAERALKTKQLADEQLRLAEQAAA